MYTDPELRERIKRKLKASSKGGRPGEWSAIKSMFLAKEYKAQMLAKGKRPYTGSRSRSRSRSKSLDRWMSEKWRTFDGKPAMKSETKTDRFLPDKVWGMLTPAEVRRARRSKSRSRSSNPDSVMKKAACFRKTHSVSKCLKK